MDRTPHLDTALSFVISRIAEQAKLSGDPLSDDQRLLLKYRRPLADQLLLIIAALLFTAAMMVLMFLAGEQPWTLFQWAEIGSGSVVVLLLAYLASRRTEKWQLEKRIEKCRRSSRFANPITD